MPDANVSFIHFIYFSIVQYLIYLRTSLSCFILKFLFTFLLAAWPRVRLPSNEERVAFTLLSRLVSRAARVNLSLLGRACGYQATRNALLLLCSLSLNPMPLERISRARVYVRSRLFFSCACSCAAGLSSTLLKIVSAHLLVLPE
ncbi:hypothetical protein NDU88_002719 [Pleurodeles waltl]|uniref:Secreted protein n=1 Tax=Pleurodeles waltl TaxID=8319 RepID=A0AAV7MPM4_PLEWA|nr:hypothetical protein NDU88_002719 [Pleurodeles waltl]